MSSGQHRNPDGTYDGAAVLGELSGLGRDEVQRLWEESRANATTLAACTLHDFPAPSLGERRVTCSRCGGSVDASAAIWYRRGLEHAAGPAP